MHSFAPEKEEAIEVNGDGSFLHMFVDIVRLNEYTILIRKVYIISYLA